MATGSILFTPGSGVFPDGSASNLAAALTRRQGTEANPKKHFFTWDFDGSGALEHVWLPSFLMPANYASGGTLIINWRANATSGNVKLQARVGANTPGAGDTFDEHAQAAAATVTTGVNATEARRTVQSSITLTMDSATAGDQMSIVLFRDSADGADTCTVDAEVLGVEFRYTTT